MLLSFEKAIILFLILYNNHTIHSIDKKWQFQTKDFENVWVGFIN